MVALAHRTAPRRTLNEATQLERREVARQNASRTIWDFGCAASAPAVQLQQFDHAIGELHDGIALANHDLYGDPVPARLVQRQASNDDAEEAELEQDEVQVQDEVDEEDLAIEVEPEEDEVSEAEPVQARAKKLGGPEAVQRAARHGLNGGRGSVPHLGAVQRAFGHHDVSSVGAVVGGKGREACEAMDAEAYASGDAVVFRGAPSLFTVAHELAHVVQQRRGVSLQGGVGRVGDRYEREADHIAGLVVSGRSVEGVLDQIVGHGGGRGAVHTRGQSADAPTQRQVVQQAKPAAKPQTKPAVKPTAKKPVKPAYRAPDAKTAPARTANLQSVKVAHQLEQLLAQGRVSLGQVEAKAAQMRRLWNATLKSQNTLDAQAKHLQQQINKADGLIAFNTTLSNWIGTFDTVLSLGDQATEMVTSISKLVQAGKRTKSAVMGVAKQLKAQKPDPKKLQKATSAAVKQGQAAHKQGQASVDNANAMAGTFAKVDDVLRNATAAPDGQAAQQELAAMLKELDIKGLMKDKAKIKGKLQRLAIKGGAKVQAMAAAHAHAELQRRKAAAEAALADVRAASLRAKCVHRAVNHGLASLEHEIKVFRALSR